jgi:O-Antigen ligase
MRSAPGSLAAPATRPGLSPHVGSAQLRGNRRVLTRWNVGAVLIGAAIGWSLVTQPKAAVVLLALGACVAVQAIGLRRLVVVLVAATFVTRFRVVAGGFHFLPEHVVLVALLLSLALSTRLNRVYEALRSPPVMLLGLFIAWAGVTSVLRSPEPAASLAIVGWLGLDWMILICLLSAVEDRRTIERVGCVAAVAAAVVAIGLWCASSFGITAFGTQIDPLTGARAVYGLADEANILASTLAVWLFLILTGKYSNRFRLLAVCIIGTAMALALTRAAIVGLVLGLVIWALLEGKVARRLAFRTLSAGAAAIVALALLAPSAVSPFTTKLGAVTTFNSGTGQLRVQSWESALGDIKGVPDALVGLGLNSFGQRHLDPTVPELDRRYYLGNLPLEVLYDTGLIGVGLLAAALAAMRPLRRAHPGRAVGLTVLFLVCSITTSAFWFGSTWLLIALALRSRPAPAKETVAESVDARQVAVAGAR